MTNQTATGRVIITKFHSIATNPKIFQRICIMTKISTCSQDEARYARRPPKARTNIAAPRTRPVLGSFGHPVKAIHDSGEKKNNTPKIICARKVRRKMYFVRLVSSPLNQTHAPKVWLIVRIAFLCLLRRIVFHETYVLRTFQQSDIPLVLRWLRTRRRRIGRQRTILQTDGVHC